MLTGPFIEIRGVTKDYGGLRPLRIEELVLSAGETVVVEGPDETAAAVLMDLVTGTTLPDAGEVRVGGVATSEVTGPDQWLIFLEQFGIVNPRVVLLDDLTARQNLAVPLTLDIDPLPETASRRAGDLATAVGLPPEVLDARLAAASALTRFRVRLGRAMAHDPRALLLEHPTLGIPSPDVPACSAALAAVAGRGNLAVLAISADPRFSPGTATRHLTWKAANGRLAERHGWRAWRGRG